jgi:hypothetical protein
MSHECWCGEEHSAATIHDKYMDEETLQVASIMHRSADWPQFPFLPLVKRQGEVLGVLLPGRPTVYLLNLFEISRLEGLGVGLSEQLVSANQVSYIDLEEVALHWRVD